MSQNGSGTTSTDDPFAARRARMVERQLRHRGIADERVLAAMGEVPRERFVPETMRRDAYRDGALRIGEGQTISQPWIVACMTALLELEGDERVLEVGTGSGYAAAVLSRLCREVVTIERFPSLAEDARGALEELGYGNVEVRVGDGSRGAPDRAPFGGISVTATALGGPPPELVEQLSPGAALVCPVDRGGRELLMRFRDGEQQAVAPVRFVPLVSEEPPEEPEEPDRPSPEERA
jgi:protein-L-isoaspartate(D-aspartate) O-methyltransferase